MKPFFVFAVFARTTMTLFAQAPLSEPPEFPANLPGPTAEHPGDGCFELATGTILPGDVDWVQVSIPVGSTQTVIDVDFPTGPGASALLAQVVGGSTAFNVSDSNSARDNLCGLGASSVPIGNTLDSAVDVRATPGHAVINIAVTGAEDTSFTGAHDRSFTYSLWVFVLAAPCATDADCADALACTLDTCDAATGHCANTPDESLCDNGRFCDGAERCDGTQGCRSGPPPFCGDGVACTVDRCDVESDECLHTADDERCSDRVFCNGREVCDVVAGCQTGANPCPGQRCRESDARCVDCLSDTDCDDGAFCNGVETCDAAGVCQEGSPPCLPDQTCNPATRSCEGGGLTLDIKPGQCPNRLNPVAQGFLPAAVVGSPGLDARNIAIATLRLSRADGVGDAVSPHEGPPGPHSVVTDVATPFDGVPCGCHHRAADGVLDLSIKFDVPGLVRAFQLDALASETVVELRLTGQLRDGTAFSDSDCVTVAAPGGR